MIAWDLIGYDPCDYPGTAGVMIAGGRTVYEAVDNTANDTVRLGRLDTSNGLRAIYRYVHADTPMCLVPDTAA